MREADISGTLPATPPQPVDLQHQRDDHDQRASDSGRNTFQPSRISWS